MCEHCNIEFKRNQELLRHTENLHIHDNWPNSGSKRTVCMVNTSSVTEPKKKKAAEEEEMKERSDQMDKIILDKR